MASRKGRRQPLKVRPPGPAPQTPLKTIGARPGYFGGARRFFSAPWPATLLAAVTIVVAAVLAYRNSFAGTFIFDDEVWITGNPAIRQLWPIQSWLLPQPAATVGGRPVISLTLAINYALGGTNVWGYHAVNLAIHILAALTLFGILRRTLSSPGPGATVEGDRSISATSGRKNWNSPLAATPLALAATLLWTVHPVQTQAVTYIIQRCESLMALFYLLTLYCVIRGAESQKRTVSFWRHPIARIGTVPWLWSVAALVACLLGMATKEVMVTAPVAVLLYDRTFLSGSFRHALRARYGLYLGLAASWTVVVLLLLSTNFYGGTTGFAVAKFTWWSYLLTQSGVLVHYLRVTFWPSGLCLDYGWPPARTLGAIVPPGLLIVALLALTGWALVKRPAFGFLGAWFFLILSPTSSIVPIADAAYDHRMYLPLAAVSIGVVMAAYAVGRRLVDRGMVSRGRGQIAGVCLTVLAATALGICTYQRNALYGSELSVLQDEVAKAPGNARAHNTFGAKLFACGRTAEAVQQFQQALEIQPDYANAHCNLGIGLATVGRLDEAIGQYRRALDLKPSLAEACYNLGNALVSRAQYREAVSQYRRALELKPGLLAVYESLARLLAACPDASVRNGTEAIAVAQQAVDLSHRQEPTALDALAAAYAEAGRFPEAAETGRQAMELAAQQGKMSVAEAMRVKLRFYQAGLPFRPAPPRPSGKQ